MKAWRFITDVANTVNFRGGSEDSPNFEPGYQGLYEGTTIMTGTMYPQEYNETEYSKNIKISWVPYPKEEISKNKDGVAQFLGIGMLLPKKTVKPDLSNVALKFMELWATRYTEAYFDNLSSFEYYRYDYNEKKELYDFLIQNVSFSLAMSEFIGSDLRTKTKFFDCFRGNPEYNVQTEATKGAAFVRRYIRESIRFGA